MTFRVARSREPSSWSAGSGRGVILYFLLDQTLALHRTAPHHPRHHTTDADPAAARARSRRPRRAHRLPGRPAARPSTRLTPFGRTLSPVILAMAEWGRRHKRQAERAITGPNRPFGLALCHPELVEGRTALPSHQPDVARDKRRRRPERGEGRPPQSYFARLSTISRSRHSALGGHAASVSPVVRRALHDIPLAMTSG